MNKLLWLSIALLMIGSIMVVSATPSYTFKQNKDVDLKVPVFDKDNLKSGATTTCYLSVRTPTQELIVDNQAMQYNSNSIFNYTITSNLLSELGEYPSTIDCSDSVTTDGGFSSFTFEITPAGGPENNTTMFIIFILIATAILVLSFMFKNYIFAVISGFAYLASGVYTMIYGFGNITNTYTQMISYIIIGFGAIITIVSGFELLNELNPEGNNSYSEGEDE